MRRLGGMLGHKAPVQTGQPDQLFDVGTETSCAAGSVSRCSAGGWGGEPESAAGRRVRVATPLSPGERLKVEDI